MAVPSHSVAVGIFRFFLVTMLAFVLLVGTTLLITARGVDRLAPAG